MFLCISSSENEVLPFEETFGHPAHRFVLFPLGQKSPPLSDIAYKE